jgi:hypothetical protein
MLDKPEWAQAGDNTLHGAIDHWQAEAAKYKALCRELADELEPNIASTSTYCWQNTRSTRNERPKTETNRLPRTRSTLRRR